MSAELRITDTNSANDSRGRAFGLEGNDFLYVLAGVVAALGLYSLLTVLVHVRLALALLIVAPLVLGPLTWILLFRQNRPQGYAEDLIDQLVNGAGWSFAPGTQPPPLGRPDHHE